MSNYNLIPDDLYDNIKLDNSILVEDYIKTLEWNIANLDLLSNLFMHAIDWKAIKTATILACYGANTHGFGDYAKYYTLRHVVPFIDPVINRPLEVCSTCNKTTLCNCNQIK